MTMSNESTPTSLTTASEIEQDSLLNQLVKQEGKTAILTSCNESSNNRPIQTEDTTMIDVTIEDTTMVKFEDLSANELKDDTLVKPLPTITPDGPTTQPTQSLPAAAPPPPSSSSSTPINHNNDQTTTTTTTTTPTVTTATTTTTTTTNSTPQTDTAIALETPAPTPITTFEEIQKQLKNTLDHVEQRNMVSGFQTLSKATGAVVDHCEQLGK